jgi:DNA-binding NtrC family response regulator
MALLTDYDWPGNVRELKNVIDRGTSLMGGSRTLSPSLLGLEAPPQSSPGGDPAVGWANVGQEGFRDAKERLIAAWERDYVTQLLKRASGNVSRAAREGGIDRVYLHRLMKKHNIAHGDED